MSRRAGSSSLSNFILSSVPSRVQKWKKGNVQIGKLFINTWTRGNISSLDHISGEYNSSDMEENHKVDERIDIGGTQESINEQTESKRNIHNNSKSTHSSPYIPSLQIEGDDNLDCSDTGTMTATEEEDGYSRDAYEDDMTSQEESS